ncbi:unnamed protein product [Hymenolepis diminuta]|uniref:RNA polymerase II elongation factor ELL N-terminal domain-containing protein n=1 Tax=Hymenolepis diminuta TaxID=6216 RepID=A0A564ZBQ6_HYMDI|nr:unnamed protein product [Hymenolepis diminuta]
MNTDLEYWHIRTTESFNRALLEKNVTVRFVAEYGKYTFIIQNSSSEKQFDSVLDRSSTDSPLVSILDRHGNCRQLGLISGRLRIAANSDSFDQLRASVLKVKEDSRKTSFSTWRSDASRAKPSPVISRQTITPKCHVQTRPSNLRSTSKERDTENVFEQYQRILVVIEYASRKRTELEKRMADAYADKSLSHAQLEAVISEIEQETTLLVKELLANEDLSPTIPPYSGNNQALDSPIPLLDFLNNLREKTT